MSVEIELRALELFGHHGVEPEERRRGQRFLYDVTVEHPEPVGDRIDETVDYRRVVELVRQVSDGRAYELLETLAAAVADALLEQLRVDVVHVRVRKPDVRLAAPVEHAAVSLTRRRSGA